MGCKCAWRLGLLSSMRLIPCIPQCGALMRSLSDSNLTCSQPWRQPVRSFAPRTSVRDHFRSLPTTQPSGPCSLS
ncbi:hypothetical protein EDB86DRAFT_3027277 [Lactarius hatsudake]|nr:hypothetical protein EDB86DRAFT_3027277 [Lactarius hatsudake]